MTRGSINLPDDQGAKDARCEHDALADLFLEDLPARADSGHAPKIRLVDDRVEAPKAAAVEVLVLGHLPVLGAAWVGPFASLRAEQDGRPIGLVRVHGSEVSIDIVCAGGTTRPEISGSSRLERAIGAASRVVGGWIVRADASNEAELLRSRLVERVTLLTGADEPAIVSAYGMLKRLSEALGSRRDVRLGVAVMGADAARAADVLRRLRESAATFLQREIEDASRLERVGACPMTGVYLGQCDGGVPSILTLMSDSLAAVQSSPECDRATPEVVVRTPASAKNMERQVVREPKGEAVKPSPIATDHASAAPIEATSSLASRIAGLTPLGCLCPHAPEVEVATDAHGRVHLVAGAFSANVDNGSAVEGLLAAAGWAHAHDVLLRRLSPAVQGGEPTLHLVTDSAPRVRPLLDSVLRVHLLAAGLHGPTMIELN